jgi:hypothetical protein
MLGYLVSASLIIVGLIHLLPLVGVLGADMLAALYGIPFAEPNLAILMRHRAVLFGLLGVFLLVAAFKPAWQSAALAAGLLSVVSFIWLAWSVGGYNSRLGRVVTADLAALLCLLVGAASYAALPAKSG